MSLRHPNHFVLADPNNRNVIITYRFLAAPVQANQDFFYIDCMTVYFNCKYFPQYTHELLQCLLGFRLLGEIPEGAIRIKLQKKFNNAHCEFYEQFSYKAFK